ncbi:hypothetical protein DFH28DRAFT_934395 [Melampsora americana]|nr:hypothetical protein DFH28DRAFT_934395 [Melampsora americana]
MSNADFDFEASKIITDNLEGYSAKYESANGSNGKTIAWFASALVKKDRAANCPFHTTERPVPTRPVLYKHDPIFVFNLPYNPIYPDNIIIESKHNSDSGSKSNGKRVHILTQDEMMMLKRQVICWTLKLGRGDREPFHHLLFKNNIDDKIKRAQWG